MSQTTRATPRSAGNSSGRIDLVPSRRAAIAWLSWLALVVAVTSCAVALPLPLRAAAGLLVVGAGVRRVRSFVLLRGSRAVRAIEWGGSSFILHLVSQAKPLAATVSAASFRPGRQWLVFVFDTAAGRFSVLVDGRYQEARAFRRLCREFSRELKASARRDSRAS